MDKIDFITVGQRIMAWVSYHAGQVLDSVIQLDTGSFIYTVFSGLDLDCLVLFMFILNKNMWLLN